ncbi:Molybdopterin molybdenumtransferase 2 [Frankia canadensis]|uniref:Molybdopterin molybdenumtransferase n=1 Tax=Frankia canadensis TaxID=1836972 RepID=A0A2I2KW88_9ACTN|nr:gephyrin-like molybdotransferase Glp [Frankia canadensis]SNQ49924.1 Molybdopterin molybdenumtransferase 2 [Frankia canadensis]SOU57214.1 Molybdopterin molybdenumtransferase 2 [Frankia canadensis]
MTTVDDHLERILAAVTPTRARRAALHEAHGCVLAADVRATVALPSFDNAAMDGYAVRAADVAGATEQEPVTLPVAADIPAGPGTPAPLPAGTAARIMTGAPLPRGADTVVQLEWTDGGGESVAVRDVPRRGQHIRRAGEDVTPGALVLAAGTIIGSAQIGLLAAVNVARPPVHPRPRIAVLSTGTELVEVGSPLRDGQIVDSNSHGIAAAARESGAQVQRLTGVPDEPDAFAKSFYGILSQVDAVVTTGGVSVGAYDVVKEVLTGAGSIRFDQVAMRPGRPQGFGLVEGVPVFTLPGNPVSALVSFDLFVRPALQRMRGLPATGLPRVEVTLAEPLRSPAGKRGFVRVTLDGLGADGRPAPDTLARPAGGQGSHQLTSLAAAQALVVIPEDVTEAPAGSRVAALLLGDVPGSILSGVGWADAHADATGPPAGLPTR